MLLKLSRNVCTDRFGATASMSPDEQAAASRPLRRRAGSARQCHDLRPTWPRTPASIETGPRSEKMTSMWRSAVHLAQAELTRRATWLAAARPSDYVVEWARLCGRMPVVGGAIQPFAAVAAIGAWRYRQIPELVTGLAANGVGYCATGVRRQIRATTGPAAPCEAGPGDVSDGAQPERVAPVLLARFHRQRYLYRRSIRYGDSSQQVLDVWRRPDLPAVPAPVLLFVPGGAWVLGNRVIQGYSLMAHLAMRGWICLSINYRVSPRYRWPTQIEDVKTAIAWARANAHLYGGDPTFLAIAGSSAGGHLAALSGLTQDDALFHEHLPDGADPSVDAVVGLYGRYDWVDQSTASRVDFVEFLERIVVQKDFDDHRDVYRRASPIDRVRPDAPPFLVVHGSADGLIPVREAREFVDALRARSLSKVEYLELPGASHGFDMTDRRSVFKAAVAIDSFLDDRYRHHLTANAIAVGSV
jgi:acetyl esterase/lipase